MNTEHKNVDVPGDPLTKSSILVFNVHVAGGVYRENLRSHIQDTPANSWIKAAKFIVKLRKVCSLNEFAG